VVGFTGDGGAMYTYQALWTAAHHRIGAKFVVCHNAAYRLLKVNLLEYWRDAGGPTDRPFPAMFDVDEPRIDFVALAGALGVPAARISHRDEVRPALTTMLDHDGPYLVEVHIEQDAA
jgi:benzoylformate decarboxylase